MIARDCILGILQYYYSCTLSFFRLSPFLSPRSLPLPPPAPSLSLSATTVHAVTNGDLRLAGIGSNRYAGRLEVFYEGSWGTVCGGGAARFDSSSGNFDMNAAHVACKQMGLGFAVEYYSFFHLPDQR